MYKLLSCLLTVMLLCVFLTGCQVADPESSISKAGQSTSASSDIEDSTGNTYTTQNHTTAQPPSAGKPNTGSSGKATSSGSAASNGSTGTSKTAIKPIISADKAAAAINNVPKGNVVKIASEKATVAEVNPSWAYTHHPMITYFKGTFYAMWSSGRVNEDDCGQRVLMATSKDGLNWSTSKPLVNTVKGTYSEMVLTAGGFHVNGDILVAYYFFYEYSPDLLRGKNLRPLDNGGHITAGTSYMTTKDGIYWSKSKPLPQNIGINTPPINTKSGRLIMCGHQSILYSDNINGISGWIKSALNPNDVAKARSENGSDKFALCEAAYYQTDDGIIHMILRSDTEYLYCAESYNEGQTWTAPYKTNFTDDAAKFALGRLPDGRFYYVGNPVYGSGRNPLMLCISEDGKNFSKQYILRDEPYRLQYKGLYKGGVYGYPQALVQGDYLYIIYSKQKEYIEITRVALADI